MITETSYLKIFFKKKIDTLKMNRNQTFSVADLKLWNVLPAELRKFNFLKDWLFNSMFKQCLTAVGISCCFTVVLIFH